jgi:tetraacyldisaccharide 4'-kinase
MMYSPGEMKLALAVFSLFSRFFSRIKNLLFGRGVIRSRRAPIPVISVGNIALGGSEKTPLAMELLSRLIALGRRPALVSRGYRGGWEKTGGVLSDGRAILGTWRDGGDEPYLIARSLPAAGVYVGKDRLTSCRRAAEAGFDCAVLDDGFQHRRLARDVDIVLYSPEERIALREPLSALCRSDILLVKAGGEKARPLERLKDRWSGSVFSYSVATRGISDLHTEKLVPIETPAKMRLLAFCGIARPRRFIMTLHEAGLKIVSFLPFPDHHPYPPASLQKIIRACRRLGADALITTRKDAVKLAGRVEEWGDTPVYVLEIGLSIEAGFDDRWRAFLEKKRTA